MVGFIPILVDQQALHLAVFDQVLASHLLAGTLTDAYLSAAEVAGHYAPRRTCRSSSSLASISSLWNVARGISITAVRPGCLSSCSARTVISTRLPSASMRKKAGNVAPISSM